MTRCAGVDGFRKKWIVAITDGRRVSFSTADTAAQVLDITADCVAVAMDVPMGLADDGARGCEPLARDELGAARSSIFPTPPRAVLEHTSSWPDALATARQLSGKGMSKQSFHILPGIKAFDDLDVDPSRVVEAHPELSFRAMHDHGYVSKKTARGQGQRLAALAEHYDIAATLADVPDGPAIDDVLDAVACAWSAQRWVSGERRILGGELDAHGKPMRIVI